MILYTWNPGTGDKFPIEFDAETERTLVGDMPLDVVLVKLSANNYLYSFKPMETVQDAYVRSNG